MNITRVCSGSLGAVLGHARLPGLGSIHSESTRSRWSRADIVSAACRPAKEAQNGPLDDAYEVQASGSVGSRHTQSGVCGGVVGRTPRPRPCVRRRGARPLGLLGHLEMDADRPDVGRLSTGDRALGLRIIEDTYARHAGAIGSVAGASRAAGLIRAVPAEKSHREPSGSAGRLRARQPRLGMGHRPALGRPRPAGEVVPSKFGPCNSFETLKSRMMDHGSERRKVADTGVFFTVTALPKVMNVHAEAGNPL